MRWYWAAWLLIGFLVPEVIALARSRPQDTLSDTVWYWCDVTPGSTAASWTIVHLLLALFMIWLFGHMVFGWWTRF